MADSKYKIKSFKLTLRGNADSITKGKDMSFAFSVASSKPSEYKLDDYSYSLYSFKLNKEMYSANRLEVVIQVMATSATTLKTDDLKKFTGVKVSLEESYTKDTKITLHQSAKEYLVFRCIPRISGNEKDKAYVTLICYSLDKILDVKKYSYCYVAQKFGVNLFYFNILLRHKEFCENNELKLDLNLQHLFFEEQDKCDSSKKNKVEYIQPYLVQYEETLYSFLRRIANRCGEFLYFENDKLHLGLSNTTDDQNNTIAIDNFAELAYQDSFEEDDDKFVTFSLTDEVSSTKELYPRHYVGPSKDNLFTVKKDYNTMEDKFLAHLSRVGFSLRSIPSWLKEDNIVNTILAGAKDWGIMELYRLADIADLKKTINKYNYDKYNEAKKKNTSASEPFIDKYNELYFDQEKGEVTPFSLINHPLESDYFLSMYNRGKKSAEHAISVTLTNSSYYPLSLGGKVKINGQVYAITKLETSLIGETTSSSATTFTYKTSFDAILEIEDSNSVKSFYPIPFAEGTIRHADTQVAIIDNNNDPQGLGRVQFYYPWQNIGKSALEAEANKINTRKNNLESKKTTLARQKELLDKGEANLTDEEKTELAKCKKDSLHKEREELKTNKNDLASLEANQEANALQKKQEQWEQKKSLESKKASLESRLKKAKEKKEELDKISKPTAVQRVKINEQAQQIAQYEKELSEVTASLGKMSIVSELTQEEKDKLVKHKKEVSELKSKIAKAEEETKDWKTKEDGTMLESEEKEIVTLDAREKEIADLLSTVGTSISSISMWPSPWVKVSTPFNSQFASIRFTPRQGDTVLIGYRNGNIEDPYILNSIASKDNFGGLWDSVDGIICSTSGHKIIINNPRGGHKFLSSFLPVNKVLKAISPDSLDLRKAPGLPGGKSLKDFTKDEVGLAGGISFSDMYGFYNINMSTDKRSIDISCPMGRVGINAMTGISISAPHGDIKIEGKNIEISAGNKLSLTSGTNIKKTQFWDSGKDKETKGKTFGTNVLNSITSEIAKSIKMVDITLLRCVLDGILKPVGGTMLIKSNRFLQLEAGGGESVIPTEYNGNFLQSKEKFTKEIELHNAEFAFALGVAEKMLNVAVQPWQDYLDKIKVISDILENLKALDAPGLCIGNGSENKGVKKFVEDILAPNLEKLQSTPSDKTFEDFEESVNIGTHPVSLNGNSQGEDSCHYKYINFYFNEVKEQLTSWTEERKNGKTWIPLATNQKDKDYVNSILAKSFESEFSSPHLISEDEKDKKDKLKELIQKSLLEALGHGTPDKDIKLITTVANDNYFEVQNYVKKNVLPNIKRVFFIRFLKSYQEQYKDWIEYKPKSDLIKKLDSLKFNEKRWIEKNIPTITTIQDAATLATDPKMYERYVNAFKVKPVDKADYKTLKSLVGEKAGSVIGTGLKTAVNLTGMAIELFGTGFKGLLDEDYSWQPDLGKGQILLSDKKGLTYNISGDKIKSSSDPLATSLNKISKI